MLTGCKVGGMSGDGIVVAGAASSGTTGMPVSGGSGGSAPGLPAAPPAPGPGNTVIATASVAGTLSVAVGARQTISVTFTSSDGQPVSGFALSGTTLPAGWIGPEIFTCTSAGTGSDCVLNLTYAPGMQETGSLTLNYIYVDHSGVRRTPGGSLTIPYAAIVPNNIAATVAPSGQISARLNAGDQTVSVNFTTDDGSVGTSLRVTSDLSVLPPNWSSAAATFGCDIVTTGNGCQLLLDYKPTLIDSGVLTLNYSYVDNSGANRTGAFNVPYSASTDSSVEGTVSPAGQINAIRQGGGQPVTVTFTTDDGMPATNLLVSSSLTALPDGWSSESSPFRCNGVGAGNGCQLHLRYTPTRLGAGTFRLDYVYSDAGSRFRTGSLNVAYAATTDNNVAGTPTPSGQIDAVVGLGAQTVAIAFSTDDARPASALTVTTDLTQLPTGWSGAPANFSCSEVAAGTGCQFRLTYTPTNADTGTLTLRYAYTNNAGKANSGSVNIPYRATTDDIVVATPNESTVAVNTGTSTSVDILFATNDGNPARNLRVSSGLSPLPPEWNSASTSFSCATITGDGACKLTLNYVPTLPTSGVLTIVFDYTNNSGIAKSGSAAITYSAN